MSSFDQFASLYERCVVINEMAQGFKQTVKGVSTGDGGLNAMLKAYRDEKTGKPVSAISRVKNLIVLRALYDFDYLNDDQFKQLSKKATSSTYISDNLKKLAPEAYDKLFGQPQESEAIINHIKQHAADMLRFGLTNLQGKTFKEAPIQDTPVEPEGKEMEDEVSSEIIKLAKGLTSDEVEGTVLDFDDVDVDLTGVEQREEITSKIVGILNQAKYKAEATPAGFNVEAPQGVFGAEEKVRDLMIGLILKYFPNVQEDMIEVFLNTDAPVEDGESMVYDEDECTRHESEEEYNDDEIFTDEDEEDIVEESTISNDVKPVEQYTAAYLTEQRNKDKYCNRTKTEYITFSEKYKPKTAWQLEELQRYGF